MNFSDKIVLKISGESIKNGDFLIFDVKFINTFAKSLKSIITSGKKIILIIGGGNIWRGVNCKNINSADSDYMGMIATVINGIFLQNIFKNCGYNSIILSEFLVKSVVKTYQKQDVEFMLENNDIIICTGGTGNPGFSTDSAAVLKAIDFGSCNVFYAKNNIDGVYTKDPNKYKDAIRLDSITYKKAIALKINVIDNFALNLSMKNNIKSIIFNFNDPNNFANLHKNLLKYSIISNER